MKRVAAIVLVLSLVGVSAAMAGAVIQRDPIVTGAPLADAEVKLVRNPNGLSVQGTVFGVTPGNAYSVWWIVLEGASVLVLNATGGIATGTGDLHFAAGLPVGSYEDGDTVPRNVFLGGSLSDPLSAVVVFHVLDHGAPIPGRVPEQISTVDAGCEPDFCPLASEIIFLP